MDGFWQHCLDQFKNELTIQQFNTWIKPLRMEQAGADVCLLAPNRFVLQWVKEKFLPRIEEIAAIQFGQPTQVQLRLEEASKAVVKSTLQAEPETVPGLVATAPSRPLKNEKSGLNPQFTFASLVTGKANQLARAAALQVAAHPGAAYNPLFVYGGGGLGKTHLIQAIGNLGQEQKKQEKT